MCMYLFTVDTSRTLITKHTMPKSPGRSRKITSSLAEYLGRLSVYDVPCTVLIFVRTCARILTFPLYLSGLLVFPFYKDGCSNCDETITHTLWRREAQTYRNFGRL